MTEGKWNCGDRIVRFERDGRAAVGRMAGDMLVELLDDRGAPTGRMESLEGVRCLPPCSNALGEFDYGYFRCNGFVVNTSFAGGDE